MTRSSPAVAGVVPAAGAARRFGGAKLLADVDGQPLLERTLGALLDAGLPRVVLIVAPAHGLRVVPLVSDPRVVTVENQDPARGMFSSIQTGLSVVPAGHAAVVLPADMPFVRARTVARLIDAQATSDVPVVATHGGHRGHPLVLPADVWPPLIGLPAGTNLKAALVAAGVDLLEVEVDDPGVLRDVDVIGDLQP